MRPFRPFIFRTCAVFTFLCVLLSAGLTGEAAAQHSAANAEGSGAPSPEWRKNIGEQLARLLRSPDPARRAEAMRLVIQLGSKDGEAMNLDPCAPVLLRLAKTEAEEENQILALTALYEVRSERTLRKLAKHTRQFSSERVRQHALRVLALAQSARAQS